MIRLNFEKWVTIANETCIQKRIYIKGMWTPFIMIKRR
jgi:hypothetical protein